MIPLNIAKAITRIWDIGDPIHTHNKTNLDLRMQVDDEEGVVYLETAAQFAAIQLFFDISLLRNPEVAAECADIVIPEAELRRFIKSKGSHEMAFEPFEAREGLWRDIHQALHGANVVRDPQGVDLPPLTGIRIANLIHIGKIFDDIYEEKADRVQVIQIAQKDSLDVIHLHVDIETQDVTIDCSVYIMPCRLEVENGE